MTTHIYQRPLFETETDALRPELWAGSFNGLESSLHQLAPYVGKLKSGMVRILIDQYTRSGDVVLDPFCGSGVVPLESVLLGRTALANDLSVYAYVLTRGKLEAPASLCDAIEIATKCIKKIENRAKRTETSDIPSWVKQFFHPKTLKEVVSAFEILKQENNYFLLANLLGILHHVRPGFLSYPASHLTPYLRVKMYPREQYPEMYRYRDLRSRLLQKIARAYRRAQLPREYKEAKWSVWNENAKHLPIKSETVNAIISSPPYFGALDYARDNRLRLWFLGVPDWKQLDRTLTSNDRNYLPDMAHCLTEMDRVLVRGGKCILVLGDVDRNGKVRNTAEIISALAQEITGGRWVQECIVSDSIPDIRRSRRATRTTKIEKILVLCKRD